MTEKQSWMFGFLARCADEGLTREERRDRIRRGLAKAAEDGLIKSTLKGLGEGADALKTVISPVQGMASSLGRGLVDHALPLAGLGAVGLGVGGGLLAANMHGDEADPAELRRRELIDEYNYQTEELERRRRAGGGRP